MRSFAQFHQNLRGSAPSPAKAFAPPPVVPADPRVDVLQAQVEEVASEHIDISENLVPRIDALETKVDEVSSAILVLDPNPIDPVSPPPPPEPVSPPPPPDPVEPVDPVVVEGTP